MSGPRVLLMRLSCRTSAKGTEYLSGFLGAARVVAFKAKEPDKFGNEQWEVYAQEPEPRTDSQASTRGQRTWDRARDADHGRGRAAGEAGLREARQPPGDFYDDFDAAIRDLTDGPGQ